MSQVVLGLRSLGIKLAIFFVMAALLAWALGGTLFPRPVVVVMEADGVRLAEDAYAWRAETFDRQQEHLNWQMCVGVSGTPIDEPVFPRQFREIAGPVLIDSGIAFGGQTVDKDWIIVMLKQQGVAQDDPMPDRLAVEQQLQRLVHGLPLQDESTILRERTAVLDPHVPIADVEGSQAPAGAE